MSHTSAWHSDRELSAPGQPLVSSLGLEPSLGSHLWSGKVAVAELHWPGQQRWAWLLEGKVVDRWHWTHDLVSSQFCYR